MRSNNLILGFLAIQVLAACGQQTEIVSSSSEALARATDSQHISSNANCVSGNDAYKVRLQDVGMSFKSASGQLSAQIVVGSSESAPTLPNASLLCDVNIVNSATGETQLLNAGTPSSYEYPWEANPVANQSPLYDTALPLGAGETKVVNLTATVPAGFHPTTFNCALGLYIPNTAISSLSKCYDGQVIE